MEKAVRLRIAAKYPGQLPMNGLTTAEYAGKLAFERKPLADRLAMIEAGKAVLWKHRLSAERETQNNR